VAAIFRETNPPAFDERRPSVSGDRDVAAVRPVKLTFEVWSGPVET